MRHVSFRVCQFGSVKAWIEVVISALHPCILCCPYPAQGVFEVKQQQESNANPWHMRWVKWMPELAYFANILDTEFIRPRKHEQSGTKKFKK